MIQGNGIEWQKSMSGKRHNYTDFHRDIARWILVRIIIDMLCLEKKTIALVRNFVIINILMNLICLFERWYIYAYCLPFSFHITTKIFALLSSVSIVWPWCKQSPWGYCQHIIYQCIIALKGSYCCITRC